MAFLNVGKHNIRLLAKVKISHRRFPRGEIHWRGDPDEADKKEEKEELDKKQVQLYSRVQQGLPSDKKLTTQYVWSTRRRISEVEKCMYAHSAEEKKKSTFGQ